MSTTVKDLIQSESIRKGRGKGYHSKYALPSELCSFEKMLRILKCIVQAAKEGDEYHFINTPQVVRITGGIRADVSRYLPFFSQAGLIEQSGKGKPFRPTKETVQFVALEEWAPSEAKAALREAFQDKWFAHTIDNALEEDNFITHTELVARLRQAADADNSLSLTKKLERLVDLLKYAEYIVEDSRTNKIRLNRSTSTPLSAHMDRKGYMGEEGIQKILRIMEARLKKTCLTVDQRWSEEDSSIRFLVFSKEALKPEALKIVAEISDKIEELATYLTAPASKQLVQ